MLVSPRISSTIQQLKLSSYHHCGWGQDHPASSEVGPRFESQHHVDISAEPLHACRRERDSEALIPQSLVPVPGCPALITSSSLYPLQQSLPSHLGGAGVGPSWCCLKDQAQHHMYLRRGESRDSQEETSGGSGVSCSTVRLLASPLLPLNLSFHTDSTCSPVPPWGRHPYHRHVSPQGR